MTPTHSMRLAVLLPYRNAEGSLAAAMKSVLDDLAPGDVLVAIDDGSTDRSRAIVHGFANGKLVHVDAGGVGIAKALAIGLMATDAPLVARMDADDVSLPGRMDASRAALLADPSLGAVAVRAEAFADDGELGSGIARYVAWQNALVTPEDHAKAIFVESPMCHPATTIRRSALDAVGGFHDPPWAEDYDLWLRLHRAGYGLAKVPEILFRWRIHAASLTWTDARYSPGRHREARAHYLAQHLSKNLVRSFGIWGGGRTGRRLARALEAENARPSFFVDIDPEKIGRAARGVPILDVTTALGRGDFLVVAVGAAGARDVVRARLAARGRVEGKDYVCAS